MIHSVTPQNYTPGRVKLIRSFAVDRDLQEAEHESDQRDDQADSHDKLGNTVGAIAVQHHVQSDRQKARRNYTTDADFACDVTLFRNLEVHTPLQ